MFRHPSRPHRPARFSRPARAAAAAGCAAVLALAAPGAALAHDRAPQHGPRDSQYAHPGPWQDHPAPWQDHRGPWRDRADSRGEPAPRAPQYTAEQVHRFLVDFYGEHGPTPWERAHLVTGELRLKAARTTGYDLLLCARSAPDDIRVGPVTTAASAGVGWATVYTSWDGGRETSSFTAYVFLDTAAPLMLADVDCAAPAG
ncbi:hypothetical protein GQS52_02855 [Streptomyces sp. SCUT-3]|uniref:hypothetical protein n=1 Tax=Streptomyces sp. SCUT-3 TaxID=2684469 RepID=UPI0015FB86E0|nr:hypothetical protein [Streptomyces sp. SCUT-3]QMV20903.1 hypothetical protein GQS52_02855 [Streptomyces sp. SCUT-3]